MTKVWILASFAFYGNLIFVTPFTVVFFLKVAEKTWTACKYIRWKKLIKF